MQQENVKINREQLESFYIRLIEGGMSETSAGKLLEEIAQHADMNNELPQKGRDWWSKFYLELGVTDHTDTTLQALGFPSHLEELSFTPETRKGLVVDEVTMQDLKLRELADAINQTQTAVGYRMLNYLIQLPLRDSNEIRKRQSALKELSESPESIATLSSYFNHMSKCESGFVEYVFLDNDKKPSHQAIFQAARSYLSFIPPVLGVIRQLKSDKWKEVAYNLEELLRRDKVRKMYESLINGDLTSVMILHPATWQDSISARVVERLERISPVMKALAYAKISADLGTGKFFISPRPDGQPVEIHYPLDLNLDLNKVREEYVDKNKVFNLYYMMGFVEAFSSLADLGLFLGTKTSFFSLNESDRFDCTITDPIDPIVFRKQRRFVPNDYYFDEKLRGYVITGPNTGGKTVYAFTLPRLQALKQTGAPIPVRTGSTSIADYIVTLRPASKEQVGEGRYLHSLVRGRELLERVTPLSLIAIDDFEGTDPEDCYRASLRILQSLGKIGSAFMMTTQDSRIGIDVESNKNGEYKGINAVQLRCDVQEKKAVFYYKVIPGVGKSIGEVCASAAGMDTQSLNELIRIRGY